MKRKKQYRQAEPPCAELRPEDGIDPAVLFGRRRRRSGRGRKDRQLCRQAFEAFCLVMEELSLEPWAADLFVVEVTPAPDASRLRVAIGIFSDLAMEEALGRVERLTALSAQFRWELGRAIARKRVPELFFELAAEDGED
jgi:hypothetical protein